MRYLRNVILIFMGCLALAYFLFGRGFVNKQPTPVGVAFVAALAIADSIFSLLEGKWGGQKTGRLEGRPARIVAVIVLIVALIALVFSIRELA